MFVIMERKKFLTFLGQTESVTDCSYAAFYADSEHELCEMTRRYKLCLIYNLVYSGDGSEVVAKWEQDDDDDTWHMCLITAIARL